MRRAFIQPPPFHQALKPYLIVCGDGPNRIAMFVDPCFEEFDSFDGDYIPLGRLNAFEDSAGNQGMNDRFQFRQGG